MKVKRLSWTAASLVIACLLSGCSDPENGMKPFVPPTPEQTKQFQDQQVKSIQDNPNIPDSQKPQIIAMYRGGNRSQPPIVPAAGPSK